MAEKKETQMAVVPGGGLVPSNVGELWQMAKAFAASGLMPKNLDKAESVLVAIQMGLEVGLAPMQAVQNIAVINGRPSVWGDAALGLVRASGLLEYFDEQITGSIQKGDLKATCTAKRKGEKNTVVREFSLEDAKLAGLFKKQGPWSQYPKRMMQMRARSWVLRDLFTDVLKGLRVAEEVMDMPEDEVEMAPGPDGGWEAPETAQDPTREPPITEGDLLQDLLPMVEKNLKADVDKERLWEFVATSADTAGMGSMELMQEAMERLDDFCTAYGKWLKENPEPEGEQEQPEEGGPKMDGELPLGEGSK